MFKTRIIPGFHKANIQNLMFCVSNVILFYQENFVINFLQVFIFYLMMALFRPKHVLTCLEQLTTFML